MYIRYLSCFAVCLTAQVWSGYTYKIYATEAVAHILKYIHKN